MSVKTDKDIKNAISNESTSQSFFIGFVWGIIFCTIPIVSCYYKMSTYKYTIFNLQNKVQNLQQEIDTRK
jgi:hypothetical protein